MLLFVTFFLQLFRHFKELDSYRFFSLFHHFFRRSRGARGAGEPLPPRAPAPFPLTAFPFCAGSGNAGTEWRRRPCWPPWDFVNLKSPVRSAFRRISPGVSDWRLPHMYHTRHNRRYGRTSRNRRAVLLTAYSWRFPDPTRHTLPISGTAKVYYNQLHSLSPAGEARQRDKIFAPCSRD